MSADFDAIVLGGGPNSLTAAAYLGKAGLKVGLFEERKMLGGEASTEELFPGHFFNTVYPDGGLFEQEIIRDLKLRSYGLTEIESPVAAFSPSPKGLGLTLWKDIRRAQKEIEAFSPQDAASMKIWQASMQEYGQKIAAMARIAPPSLIYKSPGLLLNWAKVILSLRRMGGRDMMEFMRILPMGVKKLLDENFENEQLKGLLTVPALNGLMQGPRAAGTAFMLMYQHMGAANGGFRSNQVFQGGAGALSAALGKACEAVGVRIHLEQEISRIILSPSGSAEIELMNGEKVRAKIILSGFEARRTFFDLVGAPNIEPRFMRRLRSLKLRGSTASIHLALSGLPGFPSAPGEEALSASIVICPSLDYAEKAYDNAKYGLISDRPILEARIPTLLDKHMAPDGKHSMSIQFRYAAFHLRDGDWDSKKDELAAIATSNFEAYAPGFSKLIEGQRVITPLDYQNNYGFTEGSLSQGQMSLDQLLLMRPVPGFAGYRSPLDKLYFCGPAAHPGGGLSGMPGRNAALQIIKEIK